MPLAKMVALSLSIGLSAAAVGEPVASIVVVASSEVVLDTGVVLPGEGIITSRGVGSMTRSGKYRWSGRGLGSCGGWLPGMRAVDRGARPGGISARGRLDCSSIGIHFQSIINTG